MVFELILVGSLLYMLNEADQARAREQRGRELANRAYSLMGLHVQRITQFMIYKSTDDPAMLAQARETSDRMRSDIGKIHELVEKDPKSNETWKTLDRLVRKINDEHEQATLKIKEGDKTGASLLYISMRRDFEKLLRDTDALAAQQATSDGPDLQQYSETIRLALYASIVLSLLTAFGLAYAFRKGTQARLQVIMANTQKLAAGKPPGQRLKGNDELAQIDDLYHKMHDALTILRRRERAVVENVADVVLSVDASLRICDINKAAYKSWGYEEDSLVAVRLADLISENEREAVLAQMQEAARSRKRGEELRFECSIKKEDGTTADTEWSVTWSQEEESFYCVIHDISERKTLERMKAEFVAMVSHEIRTPLASMQMTHSLLKEELAEHLDEFMNKSLDSALDNTNRLMALVNNLLDLDKLESGFINFIAEDISAAETVEKSIGAVESILKSKSITVERNINPAIKVHADSERLVQVLINLIANAGKYSPQGSTIKIAVKLETGKNSQQNQNLVRFSVSDMGRGIPQDKLATVFERFSQVEAADEKVHKGSGLGLAICRAIIERHQGKIGVESNDSSGKLKGTTFWFTIPAAQ